MMRRKKKEQDHDAAPLLKRALFDTGIRVFLGFVLAMSVGWLIGKFFSLKPLWRLLIGFVLASATNGVILYKISTGNDD